MLCIVKCNRELKVVLINSVNAHVKTPKMTLSLIFYLLCPNPLME